jgi:hypothetical protein
VSIINGSSIAYLTILPIEEHLVSGGNYKVIAIHLYNFIILVKLTVVRCKATMIAIVTFAMSAYARTGYIKV